jgi:hypothetical protein
MSFLDIGSCFVYELIPTENWTLPRHRTFNNIPVSRLYVLCFVEFIPVAMALVTHVERNNVTYVISAEDSQEINSGRQQSISPPLMDVWSIATVMTVSRPQWKLVFVWTAVVHHWSLTGTQKIGPFNYQTPPSRWMMILLRTTTWFDLDCSNQPRLINSVS